MPISKPDFNLIFASQAPSQDLPAAFNNYARGWDEARKNNGKPTIKQFNYLIQQLDLKALWMIQNGAALPFDETVDYAEGAVVVKDGVLQQWKSGVWKKPTQTADQIFDESGLSQQDINRHSKSVKDVAELRTINAKDGDIVKTAYHTKIGLGGGIYRFEALSSKIDNNGSYIASNSSSGVWVLISDVLYFEHFGVIDDGGDQSSRMQSCLDYAQSVNIKNISFEKTNEYAIADKIWIKPQALATATVQQPQVKTIIKFGGAVLRLLSDNQIGIEVSREYVRLENPSFITSKSGCVGIFNGLSYETVDTEPDVTIRRSSQFMEVIAPCGQGLDIGIKFKPAMRQGSNVWGAYYHRIHDYSFNGVKIAFYFDESFDNLNATTRTRFYGGSHLRGACTFYCLNAETIEVFGYASEIITQTDSRLPNSEAVVIYFPRTSTNSTLSNGFSKFYGDIENCTNYYDIEAYRVEIDGRFMSATSSNPAKYDAQSWRNGGLKRTNIAAEAISAEKGKSARLKLSRTSNPTDEGGVKAEFMVGEKPDGSGFELYGSGDVTNNHLHLNLPKVKAKKIWSENTTFQILQQDEGNGVDFWFSPYPRLMPVSGSILDIHGLRYTPTTISPRNASDTMSLGTSGQKFNLLYLNSGLGVFGATPPTTKPSIVGKKTPTTIAEQNAVLDSIVSALALYGIVLDSRT